MTVDPQLHDVKDHFESGDTPWEERYSRTGMTAALYADRIKAVVSMADRYLPRGAVILDAGCGPGYISKSLADNGFSVIGCDLAIRMAQLTKARLGDANTLVTDMMSPPFRDHVFDAIVMIGVVGYSNDPAKLLHGLQRLLKPGGVVILSSANRQLLMSAIGRKISEVGFRKSPQRAHVDEQHKSVAKICTYYRAREFNSLVAGAGFDLLENRVLDFGRLHYRNRYLFPEALDIGVSRGLTALQRWSPLQFIGEYGFMNIACFRLSREAAQARITS